MKYRHDALCVSEKEVVLKDSIEGMYARRERENCTGLGGRGGEIANKREIGLAPKATPSHHTK